MPHSYERLSVTVAGSKSDNVDGYAFLSVLHEAMQALLEIDKAISTVKDGSVRWEIIEASVSSPVMLTMVGVPNVSADFGPQIADAFMNGLKALERDSRLPKHFNESAIKHLNRFANHLSKTVGRVTLATSNHRFSATQSFTANIGKLAASLTGDIKPSDLRDYFEQGALDGMVDNLIGHDELYFSLYDALSGKRVKCDFDSSLQEDVRAAWKKRVLVEGSIRYSADGTPLLVKAMRVTPRSGGNDAPKFKGKYINITGGMESSEHVRRLRDDE